MIKETLVELEEKITNILCQYHGQIGATVLAQIMIIGTIRAKHTKEKFLHEMSAAWDHYAREFND
jgi:hypothetical protein